MRTAIRSQVLCVVRRKGRYWAGKDAWVRKLALARVLPERQYKRAVKIDIGLSGCELVEIMPVLNSL